MYSATKLLFEVPISVLHKFIQSFRHNFMLVCIDEYTLNLTSVKIDHPKKRESLSLTCKRDSVFKLVCLQEFLSDLSVRGVKV